MSWFKTSGLDFSGLAKTAIAQAQRSIDKVLDIQEDGTQVNGRTKKEEKLVSDILDKDGKKNAQSITNVTRNTQPTRKHSGNIGNINQELSRSLPRKAIEENKKDEKENDNFFSSFLEQPSELFSGGKSRSLLEDCKVSSDKHIEKRSLKNIATDSKPMRSNLGQKLEVTSNESIECEGNQDHHELNKFSLKDNKGNDDQDNFIAFTPEENLKEVQSKVSPRQEKSFSPELPSSPEPSNSIEVGMDSPQSALCSFEDTSDEQCNENGDDNSGIAACEEGNINFSHGNIAEDLECKGKNDFFRTSNATNDIFTELAPKKVTSSGCGDVSITENEMESSDTSSMLEASIVDYKSHLQTTSNLAGQFEEFPTGHDDGSFSDKLEESLVVAKITSGEQTESPSHTLVDNPVQTPDDSSTSACSEDTSGCKVADEHTSDLNTSSHSVPQTNDLVIDEGKVGDLSSSTIADMAGKEVKKSSDQSDRLLQEIVNLKEIIAIREEKLVALSKENIGLQETAAILRSQLNQLEDTRREDDSEMNEMRLEFTRRIADMDHKLVALTKERNSYKQRLEETELKMSTRLEEQETVYSNALKEKQEQIVGLLEEGERLSKRELKSNNALKKYKAKLTQQEDELSKLKQKIDQTEKKEIEYLESIETGKEREKEFKAKITSLERLTDAQEDEISRLKDKLEDSLEKQREQQTNIDSLQLELNHISSKKEQEISSLQESAVRNALKEKEDLLQRLEETNRKAKLERDRLQMEVEDLQSSLCRVSATMVRKEEHYQAEIRDGLDRLHEIESRNQELSQSITAATRPLLRQIESLQNSLSSQAENWERVERNHADAIASLQQQLAFSAEKERVATAYSSDLKARVAVLEDTVRALRAEKEKIQASCEEQELKIPTLEESLKRERKEAEQVQTALRKSLQNLQNDKIFLEQQLVGERMRLEVELSRISSEISNEKGKFSKQVSESYSVKEGHQDDPEMVPSNPTPSSRSRTSSTGSSSVVNEASSFKGTGTVILERLQTQLRQREGEILVLKEETLSLERVRASLAQELLNMSSRIAELEDTCKEVKDLRSSKTELEQRYAVTLQMYGEKAEEAEELRMDLEDVKQMYKQQIQDLFSSR